MPATRHEVTEGRIGSAIEGLCVIDSAGTEASACPLTGDSSVTRHAPLCPPRKVVNMGYPSAEPGGEQAISTVIPGRAKREPGIHNHHRDYGFRARAKRRAPE